jgi:hypothetical protein
MMLANFIPFDGSHPLWYVEGEDIGIAAQSDAFRFERSMPDCILRPDRSLFSFSC